MPRSLRDGDRAPCGSCCLIRSNTSPASYASSTVPLSLNRSGSQVSSCDQEPILIEGIEQRLKVRSLPDSCLAHSPYRTIAKLLTPVLVDGRLMAVQVRTRGEPRTYPRPEQKGVSKVFHGTFQGEKGRVGFFGTEKEGL